MCEYIDKQNVPSMPLLDQLVNQRWLSFLTIDMCCHLMNEITSLDIWPGLVVHYREGPETPLVYFQ